MMTKTVAISLFAASLLVLGGIGYAAFTSTSTINVTANAGTFSLGWWGMGVYATTSTYDTCTPSVSGSVLTVTVGNMAPGDECIITGYVTDTGTLPGTVAAGVPGPCNDGGSGMCGYVGYYDNGGWTVTPLAGGAYTGTFTFSGSAPDSLQGAWATFTVTLAGTAT
jgi:hypothetical protein